MLIDYSAYLDVHVGPVDGLLEPHERMTCPLDPKHISHLYIGGGSVAILDYVVHTSVLDQAIQWIALDQLVRVVGRGLTRASDPGLEPYYH